MQRKPEISNLLACLQPLFLGLSFLLCVRWGQEDQNKHMTWEGGSSGYPFLPRCERVPQLVACWPSRQAGARPGCLPSAVGKPNGSHTGVGGHAHTPLFSPPHSPAIFRFPTPWASTKERLPVQEAGRQGQRRRAIFRAHVIAGWPAGPLL